MLLSHLAHFEQIIMSPQAWPIAVAAVMAGPGTRRAWPNFPASAQLEHGRLGHGAGADVPTAIRRATGEMIEIASCCGWGDEPLITASIHELGESAWSPDALLGFSVEQRRNRDDWNRKMEGLDWIPAAADPSDRFDWIAGTCLHSGRPVLLPADFVLIGRRCIGEAEAVAVADTSGCAAGESPKGALLSALLELIERDATGRWWYGEKASQRGVIDASTVDPAILAYMRDAKRTLCLFDITSDIGIPTVAALGSDWKGEDVAGGFATRANRAAAVRAAVMELLQMELKIAFAKERNGGEHGLHPGLVGVSADCALADGSTAPDRTSPDTDVSASIAWCLARLAACGCRVALLECTRPEFGVPVVRVVSPELCHWKPRLGKPRLIAAMQGRNARQTSANLHARPLLRV